MFNGYKIKGRKNGAFHEKLSYFVIKNKLKYDALAEYFQVNKSTVCRWCKGLSTPRGEMYMKINKLIEK